MSKVTASSAISKDKDGQMSIRQSELDITMELHKSRVEELKQSKYGGIIKSAQDLIKVIDPQNLEDIRLLFSGLRIDLETFSRTIQTYIPAQYSDTEEAIELLALSIVDLFEEIDTDGDGYISWPDLIAYFIEASQAPHASQTVVGEAETFKKTQQSAQQFSGKTSLIQLDSILPNNAQFTGLEGNSIIQVLKYQKLIFLVTNTGIYQTDNTYLFPRLIFVPDENTIMASIKKGRKVILSNRERERREMNAKKKLEKLDYEMFGENRYQFNMNKFNQKPVSNEPKTKYEIINSMKHSVINQKVDIVEAVVLEPYPLMAVMMREPIFMIISLTGNSGVSAPFNLESPVSSCCWEGKLQILYFGHQSGAVSSYKIVAKQAEHEIMAQAARAQADKEQFNVGLQTQRFLEQQITKLKEKYVGESTESIYDNQEFIKELFGILNKLSKEQLFSLAPELRKLLLTEKELQLIQKDNARDHLQALQQKLKELDATPQVQHLLPTHIFNPHLSIIQSHGMKPVQLIKSDPEAFVRAEMQPTLKETAVAVKKFGGVQLDITAELLVSRYVASGAIKRLAGGWGEWEKEHEGENFRLAAADSDGTITIIDENVGFVTCFARMHQEGVLRVHVYKDAVISVGYQKVYMLTRDVIKAAFNGNILKVETEQLETMNSMLINGNVVLSREQAKETQEFDTSRSKLMKADIYKTKALIRQIPPPRPQDTVLHSFELNDIVGIVDYKYNITFFNLVTGEHISRNAITVSGLMGMKFGDASYFSDLNYGVLPIGKYLFKITTTSNDLITNEQKEVWKYIDSLEKEEEDRKPGVEKTSLKVFNQKYEAVGSVGSQVIGYKYNHQLQELAVITGQYEITIYSLQTGAPTRVINVEQISKQYSEDQAGDGDEDGGGKVVTQSYGLIESTDTVQQQTENYLDKDISNSQIVDDGKQKQQKVIPKDVNDLLNKPKELKSSLPQFLDPVQLIKLKQQQNIQILDLLGNQITAVSCDEKGRIMFVFGTRGAVTLYWKTGCLFDYQEVSEIGKKIIDEDLVTQVENPFSYTEHRQLLKVEQDMSGGASKTIFCYSLNLDLNRIIKHVNSDLDKNQTKDKKISLVGNSRDVILSTDGIKKYFFFNDQLNKQEMLIITGACTRDYKSAPVNARVLRMISVGHTQVEFDTCRIKERQFGQMLKNTIAWQKFMQSPHSRLKEHILGPQFCAENGAQELHSKHVSFISKLITQFMAPDQETSTTATITQITIGEAIGLVAIGTSDGRVLLHDTNSTKFLKQSVTYLPRPPRASAVTAMQFLGDLPLLFVGTASGASFIYTVRPMVPGDQLVVAFQHGSYNPINYPLNLDYIENQEKNLKMLEYLIDKQKKEVNDYLIQQRKYTEFIKMTCFAYDLFIKGERNYFRGEDAHLIRNYMQEKLNKDIQDAAAAAHQLQLAQQTTQMLTTQLTANLTDDDKAMPSDEPDMSQTMSAMAGSAIGCNRPASQFSQFINVQYVAKNSSIVMQRSTPNTARNLKASSALSNKTATEVDISDITQENENEQEDGEDANSSKVQAEIALDPILMKMGCDLARGQSQQSEQVNKFLRANRKRRTVGNKIKAAILLLGFTNNFLLPFMDIQNRFVVSDVVMSKYGEVVDEFGGDDDLEIRTDAPVSKNIEERVRLSDKSRDVIKKHQKLMSARPKREEEKRYEKWVTPQEQLEIHYERQGLRLRYDWDEANKSVVRIPVRTKILGSLNGASAVTAASFDAPTSSLLVADADGFVTRYDVSKLLDAVKPEPVRLNKKQVLDVQSGKPQDIVIGFVGQKAGVGQTKLGTAALHARDALKIVYQCRAHEAAVQSVVDLKDGNIMTIGQDRRVLIWEASTMILKGQLSRVLLDKAQDGWEKLFATDIQNQQPVLLKHCLEKKGSDGKGKQSNAVTTKLQLSDLTSGCQSDLFPPAQRLECPPAAWYGWGYLPRLTFKSASLSTSILTGSQTEPVEATRNVLSRVAAVPTLDCNQDSNLLKLTGLNPRTFELHRNSWTVRAAVGRATAGKVDPSVSVDADDAKHQLLTGKPKLQKDDGNDVE